MNIKHELRPRTKASPQTSPEEKARQGRQHSGALRTPSQKPESQTNLGPIWFLALLSGLRISFLQPYARGSTLAVVTLCSQHSTLFVHFPTDSRWTVSLVHFP